MPFPPRLLLLLPLLAATTWAAASLPRRVEVAPARTSIYIGTVHLQTHPLDREAGGDFTSTYIARVFPFFFYNEEGSLRIHATDADLDRLVRGEPIDFSGLAVNREGKERQISGRATPDGEASGKIKVRIRVAPKIELIFNTTYRLPQ